MISFDGIWLPEHKERIDKVMTNYEYYFRREWEPVYRRRNMDLSFWAKNQQDEQIEYNIDTQDGECFDDFISDFKINK